MAVLELLLERVPVHLLDGKIVHLGVFGSFFLTMQSEGANTPAEFKSSKIKGVKIKFRPGKKLKRELKKIQSLLKFKFNIFFIKR